MEKRPYLVLWQLNVFLLTASFLIKFYLFYRQNKILDTSRLVFSPEFEEIKRNAGHKFFINMWVTFAESTVSLLLVGFDLLTLAWNWMNNGWIKRATGIKSELMIGLVYMTMFELFFKIVRWIIIGALMTIYANVEWKVLIQVDILLFLQFLGLSLPAIALVSYIIGYPIILIVGAILLSVAKYLLSIFIGPILFLKQPGLEISAIPNDSALAMLARRVGFPAAKIFILVKDVFGKPIKSLNAFASGVGFSKMIVIFEPLMRLLPQNQVLGVLAHELGHWYHMHAIWGMLVGILITVLVWLIKIVFIKSRIVAKQYGFSQRLMPVTVGLLSFYFLFTPFQFLFIGPLLNKFSWSCEFAADNFAKTLGYSIELQEALVKMNNIENVGLIDPLFAIFYSTHPPALNRIAKLKE